MIQETVIDGNGNILKEGDRVWTYDWGYKKIYGTLKLNDYWYVSEWSVMWDDGEDCAVLSFATIWKA